jgi:hypothetical protein
MADSRFDELYAPVLADITERSAVADGAFVDKDVYTLFVATLWANVTLDPAAGGIRATDLPALHDYLNGRIAGVLGAGATLKDCFRFVRSDPGQVAMQRLHLSPTHQELLRYFATMILDPQGHLALMQRARDEAARRRPPSSRR